MRGAARSAVALICIFSFAGCSLFGPRVQTIRISSEPSGAVAIVNGHRVGNTPLRTQVHRGEDMLVEVREEG